MRRNRKRRPSSMRRRIAADGRRFISFSRARIASEVGPTQAAAPGIQGQPGNCVLGRTGAAQQPLAHPIGGGGFFPVVRNSQSMARA